MKNNRFDEYQLKIRYKAYVQSFWLLIILIIGNEYVNQYYVWADPFMQSVTLVYIALIYISIVTCIKGAFVGMDEKNPTLLYGVYISLSVIMFALAIEGVVRRGRNHIIEDGMLTDTALQIMMAGYFGIISAINLINHMRNKKQNTKEQTDEEKR